MKIDDVIAMVNAGFTKTEIMKFADATTVSNPPEESKDPVNPPVEPKKSNNPPEESKETIHYVTIDDLRNELQKFAILNNSQPKTHMETVDDILANIINPEEKVNNGK